MQTSWGRENTIILQKKSQKKPRWVDPRVRQGLVVDEAGERGRGQILQGLECCGGDLGMEGM